jgi:hypothetical protein
MGDLTRENTGFDAEKSDGRATLAWQAEACPTYAAQGPGNGQNQAVAT